MNQVIESATNKAVNELKELVNDARTELITQLSKKVGKLSHSEEREVLALVCTPTKEESTGFVTKRTKVIIDELVGNAAKVAKPTNQQTNQQPTSKKSKQPMNRPSGLIDTNKGTS